MKLVVLILLFIPRIVFGQNQELRVGIAGGFNAFQYTVYDSASYQPENSYFTYNEIRPGSGLIRKGHALNGFSIGGLGTFAFKKWTLNLEPQYTLMRSTYTFEKEYFTERVVGSHSFRLPVFVTWRLFRKANSLYVTGGFILNAAKNYDFQNPGAEFLFSNGPLYNGGIDYGDDHFNGVLYSNDRYWDAFIGLGKTINHLNINIRWMTRTRKSAKLIGATISKVELNLSYHFLSTNDLTNKRKIYYE